MRNLLPLMPHLYGGVEFGAAFFLIDQIKKNPVLR